MHDAGNDTFVGRVEELSQLRTQAKHALDSEPQVMLVVGDPGVGKTALIEKAVTQLDAFQVLRGSGDESEADVPYALLGQLFGEQANIPAGMPVEPFVVGASLLEVLGRLQNSGAVALLVDDAHWADLSSLRALLFALRRLHADRVLVVFAVRTEEEQTIPAGISRLVEVGGGARLRLQGLTESQVEELVCSRGGGHLPGGAVRRLREHTGGNPLWIGALVEQLTSEQLNAAVLPLPAPALFARGVQSRMATCSAAARGLVAAASVAGGATALGLLGRLAEVDDPFVTLDEAKRCGLLTSRGSPPTVQVSFPHPLIRAAVYDGLDAAPRAALHRQAAAVAEDEIVRVRHQVAASPGTDEQLAQRVADLARQQRGSGAIDTAANAFVTAARLTPRLEDQDQLLLEAAETWLMGGQAAEATALLAELPRRGQSPRRDLVEGWMAQSAGQVDEAERILERAWRVAASEELPHRASAARLLAGLHLMRGRGDDCAAWAARTVRLAPSEWERNMAAGIGAMGLAIAGRTGEALAALEWVPRRGELGPMQLDVAAARGNVLLWADCLDDARSDFQRLLAATPRCGSFQLHTNVLANLAEVEHRAGNWDDAIAHGERAIQHAEDTDQIYGLGPAHALTSHSYARRGNWVLATQHVDDARHRSSMLLGNESAAAYASDAAVRLAHSHGDWNGLLVAAEPLRQMSGSDGAYEPGIFTWRELYCEALIRLGQVAAAETALAPYEQLAAERGRRSAMGAAARVRGQLHAAAGDLADAEDSFESAIAHAEEVGMPFEQALAQLAYGGVLRRSGRRRNAVQQLNAATDTFAQLRAEPFVARTDQERRGCGQTRTPRAQANTAELTPQEHSVAVLVGSGLTNRDVAVQLVVSIKTVEFHLTHIFAKLGMHSRSQLALRMAHSTASAPATTHS